MSWHCADCGNTWEGAGNQCPRCASRRVKALGRNGKRKSNAAVVAVCLLAVLLLAIGVGFVEGGGLDLLDGLGKGTPERETEVSVRVLMTVPVDAYSSRVLVRVENQGGYAVTVDPEDLSFYDQNESSLPYTPDGQGERHLPAQRGLTLTGVLRVEGDTEEIWAECWVRDGFVETGRHPMG